jgi:hypothetical protein
MRDETTIQADLAAEIDAYRANSQDMTQRQFDEHKAKLEALQTELSAVLSKGADPCKCGNEMYAPMGMVKTPAHMERGVMVPAVYEVGCAHCPPVIVESENGYDAEFSDGRTGKFVRRSASARAFSVKDAVKNWNDGTWVEDNLFNRNIPGVSDTAVQDENGVWHLAA